MTQQPNLLTILRERTAKELPRRGLVTCLNPYSYVVARRSPDLFTHFDTVTFDGILLYRCTSLFGVRSLRRLSFDMTSMARDVFRGAVEEKRSVYIVGTTEEALGRAVRTIRGAFPGIDIVGSRNGFFRTSEERTQAIEEIRQANPDILVVGMGTPLQERFLVDVRQAGWDGTGYTCGGFLHQTASRGLKYYPTWINRLNLRWLYRMYDDPALIRRYLIQYPLFCGLFVMDWLRERFAARVSGHPRGPLALQRQSEHLQSLVSAHAEEAGLRERDRPLAARTPIVSRPSAHRGSVGGG